jgi:hypothetical protein
MGLSGGKTGAKALFLEKFPTAFQNVKHLKDVIEIVGVERSQTLAVLDGNVMMNAIPATVDTFRGYVAILANQLEEACQAAAHVVVVFDEPEAMTSAKRAEQRRRDEVRQARVPLCSEDLVATITDDNFSTEDLNTDGCNVKLLMEFRKARPRFYDAVCVALLKRFQASMTGGAWSLTFDGVDTRGADRGHGIPRDAGILSSDDAFWQPLLDREVPIGEGDLKLTNVTQRVHNASRIEGTPVHGVVLNLVVTIDTDSFAIELLQQSRRERRAEEADRDELTILCLKERARKRAGDDFVTQAHYTCCDMQLFHGLVLEHFYGTKKLNAGTVARQPAALALLAVALALCGCDFVELKGMRADLALPVVRDIVRCHPERLDALACVSDGRLEQAAAPREYDAQMAMYQAGDLVDFFVDEYAKSIDGMPRMQRALASVAQGRCDAQTLRSLWTCAYWHQREFKNCQQWGFSAHSG